MKALLLHCKNYRMKVGLLANRPENIKPEPVTDPEHSETDCVVSLVTVENGDNPEMIKKLARDIAKMAYDTGRHQVVILPFAHLSNNLAKSEESVLLLDELKEELGTDFHVKRSHFGSHKEFTLDVFGHPGNVRFREY